MRHRSQEIMKPIAGAASFSTPLANNKFTADNISISKKRINLHRRVRICLHSHGPTSEGLCQATETQLPLYIKANEIDNQCGATLDTTDETSDIRLNKICEIT